MTPYHEKLSECYVEYHHNYKSDGEGYGTDVGVFATLGLGYKFLNDNIEHGTCGECQKVWKQGRNMLEKEYHDKRRDRLDDA